MCRLRDRWSLRILVRAKSWKLEQEPLFYLRKDLPSWQTCTEGLYLVKKGFVRLPSSSHCYLCDSCLVNSCENCAYTAHFKRNTSNQNASEKSIKLCFTVNVRKENQVFRSFPIWPFSSVTIDCEVTVNTSKFGDKMSRTLRVDTIQPKKFKKRLAGLGFFGNLNRDVFWLWSYHFRLNVICKVSPRRHQR